MRVEKYPAATLGQFGFDVADNVGETVEFVIVVVAAAAVAVDSTVVVDAVVSS